ncbi:TVP38/TMEM64 family protein [Limisalsivibrio acetivorans]|uniref:TVP38/TMEM64 family protein n=1 Tax=Limisalsivibrio acetivorans TaxID=1304888 RepID=UPI0003B33781|nr:TVP38/TMEM64 family protein [Limisalsivibrio acetivorans]
MKRLLILALVVTLILILRYSGLGDAITFEALKENREILLERVNSNYALSAMGFIFLYIVVTGFSLPGAAVLTLSSGFLFGMPQGWLFSVAGATIGALAAFLISRYLLGNWVQRTWPHRLERFNEDFRQNGAMYLLTMRLIPAFPFFLINFFAGLTRVRVSTYIWTTAIGIAPGGFVYAFAGRQLGTIDNLGDIVSGRMLAALALLGLLSLAPVIYRKLLRR